MDPKLSQDQLTEIYNWVDLIPLSRPKRNMPRDFSDAVLFAEIIEYYNPGLVELHNYVGTGAIPQKIVNWNTLNRKVLGKLKIGLTGEEIQNLSNCVPGAIEGLINRFKNVVKKNQGKSPSMVSKTSKNNTAFSFSMDPSSQKPKLYHKLPFSQIKKQKDVHQLTSNKDEEINLLKSQIGLLMLKSSKLEEMLKSKDRQIEELVHLIKSNKK